MPSRRALANAVAVAVAVAVASASDFVRLGISVPWEVRLGKRVRGYHTSLYQRGKEVESIGHGKPVLRRRRGVRGGSGCSRVRCSEGLGFRV